MEEFSDHLLDKKMQWDELKGSNDIGRGDDNWAMGQQQGMVNVLCEMGIMLAAMKATTMAWSGSPCGCTPIPVEDITD